ncbi:MAG: hypothetical protein FWC54_06035 [Actinomycetia bacterium]|nr:hypothetical protein [Actinomycetes bacterium]
MAAFGRREPCGNAAQRALRSKSSLRVTSSDKAPQGVAAFGRREPCGNAAQRALPAARSPAGGD